MQTIDRESDKNGKVGNQERQIESVGLVEALEGVPAKDMPDVAKHRVRIGHENG
jgi:hypothetical protein